MKFSVRLCLNFSELWMKVLPLDSSLRQLEKQVFLHKKESTGVSLQLGWTLRKLAAKPTDRGTLQGLREKDNQGLGYLKMPVPWPKKAKNKNKTHKKKHPKPHIPVSWKQGPISKESFPRAAEMLNEVAGLSVLWINGVSLDIFLLAETEHPWGKDTDLSFVYSIGGNVLPCFDKCVYKVKGICLFCCFCL